MWHASVAVLDLKRGRTALVQDLGDSTKRVIVRVAKQLLEGVGQLPSLVDQHQLAVHYRRAVTDAEWSLLPQQWCAIAAVHEAGVGVILEQDT